MRHRGTGNTRSRGPRHGIQRRYRWAVAAGAQDMGPAPPISSASVSHASGPPPICSVPVSHVSEPCAAHLESPCFSCLGPLRRPCIVPLRLISRAPAPPISCASVSYYFSWAAAQSISSASLCISCLSPLRRPSRRLCARDWRRRGLRHETQKC